MKYIILKDHGPILFPDSDLHSHITLAYGEGNEPVAGGEVALRTGHSSANGFSQFYVECRGETDIEGIKSRGADDEKLIAEMITKS